MGSLLKVAAVLGGTTGSLVGIVVYLAVPHLCAKAPGVLLLLTEYDCFGLGVHSQLDWAMGLGGLVGVALGGYQFVRDFN